MAPPTGDDDSQRVEGGGGLITAALTSDRQRCIADAVGKVAIAAPSQGRTPRPARTAFEDLVSATQRPTQKAHGPRAKARSAPRWTCGYVSVSANPGTSISS